jgi:hypothetical protein
MSKLYIANTLKQSQIVFYRMEFDSDGGPNAMRRFQPAKQSPVIPKGRQIVLGGDLHLQQIENIVTQLTRVGLVAEKDVGRLTGMVPYVFNVDRPVREETIRAVMAHNAGVLVGQGRARREAAAIAARASLEAEAQQAQIAPTAYEASIETEDPGEVDVGTVEEGYRVVSKVDDAPEPTRGKATARRSRNRAA